MLQKRMLLVADALEGVMVYALADLSFIKILKIPQMRSESYMIKKFNHPKSSISSYFLQIYNFEDQNLIKHNSKSIITINESIKKTKLLHNQLLIMSPS